MTKHPSASLTDQQCFDWCVSDRSTSACTRIASNGYCYKYGPAKLDITPATTNRLLNIPPVVSSDSYNPRLQKKFLTDGQRHQPTKTNGKIADKDYWHSKTGNAQWAKVTMAQRAHITRVEISNRCDCCEDLLTGAKVYVGQAETGVESECGDSIPSTAKCSQAIVNCNIVGDYVIVRHTYGTFNIIEMEAYGVSALPHHGNGAANQWCWIIDQTIPIGDYNKLL